MTRAGEYRVLDIEELDVKLRELKEELFNLRFQHATGQLENPMRIKETRRDIARVCTLINERKYGINTGLFEGALPPPRRERAIEEPEELVEAQTEAELEEEAEELAEAGMPVESEELLEEEVEEELKDL